MPGAPLAVVCRLRYDAPPMKNALPALALLLLAATSPHSVNIAPDVRRAVIDHFSTRFVFPEAAIWEFDSATPFILGGTLVCGKVNYQNSLRHYVGMVPFYMVVKTGGRVGDDGMLPLSPEDDPTGSEQSTYLKFCKPAH